MEGKELQTTCNQYTTDLVLFLCCKPIARRFRALSLFPSLFALFRASSFPLLGSGESLHRRLRSLPGGAWQPRNRILLYLRHAARRQRLSCFLGGIRIWSHSLVDHRVLSRRPDYFP